MLVKELIEKLMQVDQNIQVCTRGYEGGVTSDIDISETLVEVNANIGTWYYGEHEETDDINIGVPMIYIG